MIRILYFTAAWCAPCRKFGPLLTDEARTRGFEVDRVDVDGERGQKLALDHRVQSVPTVVVMRGDEPIDRFGFIPGSRLLRERLDALTA